MSGLKLRVICRDCHQERTIAAESQIIPIVGNYYCLSDGKESELNRCACTCEAFLVLGIDK